jgi:NACHT domain
MEAHFEALGPERFQRFCQSLFTYEFPHLQALEVAMSDGGRDAHSWGRGEKEGEYAIFQVKFRRSPSPVEDPLKWIEKIVKKELPKVEKLAARGASSYQLMTNTVGTSHLDTGSVDKVSSYLSEKLPIPAECWWRNDLDVRLAKHAELRWGYPELLNPTDILKELVENGLNEEGDRRTRAVRSFLAKQYEDERTVRFKQADLSRNDLLGLFIDVPVETGYSKDRRDEEAGRFVKELARAESEESFRPDPIGAARVLLHPDAQETLSKVVVEGAPGQGKSTLGQYISQVHRMRLLKKAALRDVPAEYRHSPARLPFKIDLRDFAVFLCEKDRDPFESEPEWGGLPEDWPRSLEGYLAAVVRIASGGARFDVSDLLAVAEVSYLLLVLDGLDEVAELDDRALVVEAVLAGCTRLESIALGLQVVVTSRPAAFSNSPALSDRSFRYISLASLTRDLAAEYGSKWTTARGLDAAEGGEVEETLASQMHKPHIRDLARNPMQLAILLNLILTKGKGLPDRRTDLYTNYMDVFFDREAAKSGTVREHRDALFELHSHLGWRLHADSETVSSGGTLSEKELKREVRSYLEAKGGDPSLVEQLFRGVVDRIFALVSRVEGRFEFEVQPLREYFAAHYLYSTAQVSRLGDERPGTLPERFDGLARNAYWLNVVRFYAGFYSTGEQPSLVDRLEALATDQAFALTDRPWSLAVTLLNDWSFSRARPSRERAIGLALEGLGERHVLTERSERFSGDPAPLVLPKGSGLEELSEKCWILLEGGLADDRQVAILALLNALPEEQTLPQIRARLTGSSGPDRTRWLRIAAQLNATMAMESDEIAAIADEDGGDRGERAAALVDAGFPVLVEKDEEKSQALIEGWIAGTVACTGNLARPSWLGALGAVFAEVPDLFHWNRSSIYPPSLFRSPPSGEISSTATVARRFLLAFFGEEDLHEFELPWDDLIEECRQRWGDGPGLTRLAMAVVGRAGRPESAERQDLADRSGPLLPRLRYAITRGGVKGGDWWQEQLRGADATEDKMIAMAGAITWTSGQALEQVLPDLEQGLKGVKGEHLVELCTLIEKLARNRGPAQSPKLGKGKLDTLSLPLTVALAHRDQKGFGRNAFDSRLRGYTGESTAAMRFCLTEAVTRLLLEKKAEKSLLSVARRAYKAVGYVPLDEARTYGLESHEGPGLDRAREIVSDAGSYPLVLVEAAEARCTAESRRAVPPLVNVGEEQRWFAE